MGIRKTITNLIQLLSLKNAERLGTDSKGNLVAKQATDISGKVDKVVGKGLSTNDYTTPEKQKLAGLDTALATINSKITTLQNAERKGVQYAPDIALTANTAKAYNLGTNELMSLKLLGSGTVQIGTTSSTLGDLGEITGVSGDKIELGSIEGTVYLKSTTSMSVKPKIFKP